MLGELAVRFLIGGLVVSVFAVIGDVIQPKSLAGIFGAAPSVALATLSLTFAKHSGSYVAVEGQSMALGSVALGFYCIVASWLLQHRKWGALKTGSLSCLLWLIVAFSLRAML